MLTRDYYLPFYEEVLEFLASGPSSRQLAAYQPSPTAQARFSWLLEENRQRRLAPDEEQELEHYVALERMLSLLKAKAFSRLNPQ